MEASEMKYYDKLPETFLLIRLVATRCCNYRCPYCYVPLEKRTVNKTMFSHHNWDEWFHALEEKFPDRNLEFYFTGGEPLIIKDCIFLIKKLVELDNVRRIRIDTNLSAIEHFLENVDSEKVRFLTAFHPTQISLDAYIGKVNKAKERKMVDVVNFVASKENLSLVNTSPHKLIKVFEDMGLFLNIAKDFHRGLSKAWDYDSNYKMYVDMLQYPLDSYYMNLYSLNKGFLCGGGGRHYISINRHGQVFSCGGKIPRTVGYGNIFDNTLHLSDHLHICEEDCCPSIISYSFSCSNNFSPIDHTRGYAERCNEIRKGIPEQYLDSLWKKTDIDNIIVKKTKKRLIDKIRGIKDILFEK
jgi:sulfatase maturation enzyme AslB (radical SAM superfamily)